MFPRQMNFRLFLPDGAVVVEAVLQGRAGEQSVSEALMDDYIARREESQPTKDRSAGSTFRNPAGYSSTGEAGDPMDLKAWKLIECHPAKVMNWNL